MSEQRSTSGERRPTGDRPQERAGATVSVAKEQASAVAASARSRAQDVAGAASNQARAVAQDAQHQARQVLDESRRHLREQATEQAQRLAGTVRDVSQQLQGMARGESPPEGMVADLTEQAATYASSLADRLEHRGPDQLLDDVRRFARRRPNVFLLGALGAGIAVGRLMRSTGTTPMVEAAKGGADGGDQHGKGEVGASAPSPGDVTMLDELAPAVRP